MLNRRDFFLGSAAFIASMSTSCRVLPLAGRQQGSLASQWLDVLQDIIGDEVERTIARPTVLSRQMAIPCTAMFDAWAAYDAKAVGTQANFQRRPEGQRTQANREKAISYAAYRTLYDVLPAAEDRAKLEKYMRQFGYDPADTSTDLNSGVGVGNAAAAAILASRANDGANQSGKLGGGKTYGDYTGYKPVNPADRIIDPDRWQPIAFVNPRDPKGPRITPGYLTPHWHKVTPFSLKSGGQFRPSGPPKVGTAQLKREVDECLQFNASLTCEQKSIVEFMRDGPRSTGQSGHWLKFARMVSKRDNYTLDQDIQLYFTVANAALDAFIAAWDSKRVYDSSRPWTLIHHYYAGKKISAWRGPNLGVGEILGQQWHPYSPDTFITPPFPGYVSGHSCVSAGCAKVLELFTGSDAFGEVEIRNCGELTEAKGESTRLELPTFTATAEMAGLSRVMGGYHIQADNVDGLALGRSVAHEVFKKSQAHIKGTVAAG